MAEPTPVLPEVLSQIRSLSIPNRPLIICDVDEVILHLIRHLEVHLDTRGLKFLSHDYKFTGNIANLDGNHPLGAEATKRLLIEFFDEISHQQDLVDGADLALNKLSEHCNVVLLTNLPGTHNKPRRRELLAKFGIDFPMITNSGPKGGAVAALASGVSHPVIFVDDSPTNHRSVNASLPSCTQVQFIADARFLARVEKQDHIDMLTGNWQETASFIEATL